MWRLSKIKKNGMNGIVFVSAKFFVCLSLVDNGTNIVKYRLNTGEVISTNQSCWHRNNCLLRLNESKGLFNNFLLVKRHKETYQERGASYALQ